MRAPAPVHGKLSEMRHQGEGVFRGINGPFKATRYHSLVVERDTCRTTLDVTAETDDGLIMGLVAQDAARARRAVPSRKHRLRARPPDAEEFSRARRAVECHARSATGPLRRRCERRFQGLHRQGRRRRALTREEASRAFDRMMSGEATPSQMGAHPDGAAGARRNRRRDHRRGQHHARQDDEGRSARPTPSMWSAPAATPPAPTTSRPAPR